jgi:hypothetical protein
LIPSVAAGSCVPSDSELKFCCAFFRLWRPPRCFFLLGAGAGPLGPGSLWEEAGAVLEVGMAIDSGPATFDKSAIVGEGA